MPENKYYVGYIGNFYPWKNSWSKYNLQAFLNLYMLCGNNRFEVWVKMGSRIIGGMFHRMYETVTGNIFLAYYKTQALLSYIFISHLSRDLLCDIKVIMTFKQQKGLWHTWHNKQISINMFAFQWHHNERPGVSKHGDLMVCSTACSCAHQRKHQRSASLAFVREIHQWPVDCLHKGPITRKCFHLVTSSWPFSWVISAMQGAANTSITRQAVCWYVF